MTIGPKSFITKIPSLSLFFFIIARLCLQKHTVHQSSQRHSEKFIMCQRVASNFSVQNIEKSKTRNNEIDFCFSLALCLWYEFNCSFAPFSLFLLFSVRFSLISFVIVAFLLLLSSLLLLPLTSASLFCTLILNYIAFYFVFLLEK